MPRIEHDRITVAFDMHGCPNRCRHCWLGYGHAARLSEDEVRWGAAQFRDWVALPDTCPQTLAVATHLREPDFADHYRDLYDLENELSDGPPERFELLSIWRLARDASYAEWARSVGPDTCQISFFGMRDTTDWFYQRKGAFDDAITATERLLEVGMKPRWQIFLTTKLLPELDAVLGLVDTLQLRERVAELGGTFQMFMHPPGPDGEGLNLESLRPTAEQVADLPETILQATRKHTGRDVLWQTESELYNEIVNGDDKPETRDLHNPLWFFVFSNWDVYANAGDCNPWYRLGNLKEESVATILQRYENDVPLGLRVQFHESPVELAKRFGAPDGQKIYDKGDLLTLYRQRRCREEYD